MKNTIYTIPLHDAFDVPGECPFCQIQESLESDALEYVLGPAMMEPNTRIDLNKRGFCRKHFSALTLRKNTLALALVLETRLAEILRLGENALTEECFICNHTEQHMKRYFSNTAFLFANDPSFRAKFEARERFCLPHVKQLLDIARKELKRKWYEELRAAVLAVLRRDLTALRVDARKVADSFDYRNAGKALGAEKDVLTRAEKVM
jgi:hypothetical protein